MKEKEIALNIVTVVFKNKKDKAGKPYLGHLTRVAEKVSKYYPIKEGDTYTQELLEILALLHDLIEDFPEWTFNHIYAIFQNEELVDALRLLTKKAGMEYSQYINGVSTNKYATAVKLADLEDNMDLTRLDEFGEDDIKRTYKYHKSYVKLKSNK